MATVRDIFEYINTIAPPYMKESWDNVGLNCGRMDKEVETILVALDPFEAVCKEALETLLKQQVDHKLDGRLCGEVPIAHKTGEDTKLSNDVGIVFARQPFVVCFAGHDTDVYAWEDLMRNAAYDLWQAQLK